MESTEEKTGQVSWNIAEGITIELAMLSQRASSYYLSGNLVKWFFTLKAIKMRILPKLNTSERKELSALEAKIWKVRDSKQSFSYGTEKYNEKIFDLLKKYGFYPGDKELKTRIV